MPIIQEKDSPKKMIGECLKAADRFIKGSDYFKALEEVSKALAIEPNNMYALAYNERVKVALEAARKKEEEEKVKKLSEDKKTAPVAAAVPHPPTAPSPPVPIPSPKPAETLLRAANAPDARPTPVASPPPPPPSGISADDLVVKIKKEAQEVADKKSDMRYDQLKQEFSAIQLKLQQDISTLTMKLQESIASKEALQKLLDSAPVSTGKSSVDLLRKLFEKSWEKGSIYESDRIILAAAKIFLEMSEADFSAMEEETRSSSYIASLRQTWQDGIVTPEEADYLEQLRKKLNVSAEEHLKLESQIRRESQGKR